MARVPRIDSPCPINRPRFKGATDHCSHCDRTVHNLNLMSDRERREFTRGRKHDRDPRKGGEERPHDSHPAEARLGTIVRTALVGHVHETARGPALEQETRPQIGQGERGHECE